MPSLIKIPLPTGKLGVVFKGTPPTIQRVGEESPMKGRVKEGYIFKSLILNDGTSFENLTTKQLIETLNECSNEEGRKLVMVLALPDGTEITLPEGSIGATVQTINGKPTITQVDADSPLRHDLRVGYVVDKVILEDGTELTGHTAEEIEVVLADDSQSSCRRLSLVNPDKSILAPKKVTLPMEKAVTLPAGKLGIVFKGSPASVSKIVEDSPLRGKARIGFVVASLKLPDGTEYIGYNSSKLCQFLQATAAMEGRILLLKSPENPDLPSSATSKVTLPSFGNAEEIGLAFGDGASIAEIKESSTLVGKLVVGQTVVMVHDGKDKSYQNLNLTKATNAIWDSSGCTGRYLVVKD
jgi:hypothetical protein